MSLITCPECGKQMSDKAAACPSCGAPVIKKVTCPECGKELSANATACPNCGCPVEASGSQNVRPSTMRPTAPADKTKQRVQYFLMNNKKFLPDARLPKLRDRLSALSEEQFQQIECVSFKDPTMLLIISIFLGELGVDRFMLEDTKNGVLKLLLTIITSFIFLWLIWWLIDLFKIMDMTKEYNYKKLEETFKLFELQ